MQVDALAAWICLVCLMLLNLLGVSAMDPRDDATQRVLQPRSGDRSVGVTRAMGFRDLKRQRRQGE